MHPYTVIVICGPTAVGKTAVAIKLAEILRTDIISADSRQCFRELNIGVAKPEKEERQAVHHYFINSHSITDEVNAGVFENYALQAAATIFQNHNTAIMVGGTGLYIKAFCDGLDVMPVIDLEVRESVIQSYNENGLLYLQEQVQAKDPLFWEIAEHNNPQRLMRALEVILSSGKSITTFRKGKKENRPFNIIKVGLELPREKLYQQINTRVDKMIEQGLLEEARELLPYRHINALQTVGYKELFEHFDERVSLAEAISNIKTNTRHYAKRQLTWFKKDHEINWFNAVKEDLFNFIAKQIS